MTTNPSTGLPEELEKIVQKMSQGEGSGYRDELRLAMRDVLDWACKKVCVPCSKGWPAVRSGDTNFPWIHPKVEGKIAAAVCAASVLREGNR